MGAEEIGSRTAVKRLELKKLGKTHGDGTETKKLFQSDEEKSSTENGCL